MLPKVVVKLALVNYLEKIMSKYGTVRVVDGSLSKEFTNAEVMVASNGMVFVKTSGGVTVYASPTCLAYRV
jgi:hypothetical protein